MKRRSAIEVLLDLFSEYTQPLSMDGRSKYDVARNARDEMHALHDQIAFLDHALSVAISANPRTGAASRALDDLVVGAEASGFSREIEVGVRARAEMERLYAIERAYQAWLVSHDARVIFDSMARRIRELELGDAEGSTSPCGEPSPETPPPCGTASPSSTQASGVPIA